MKKVVSVVLCIVVLASLCAVFAGCDRVPRGEKLRLFLPGEYMDESIFAEFEAYYLEETGERVVVEPKTFSSVEEVKRAVDTKVDYDLLCPSDYMIEYLISKKLLLPLEMDITADGLFKEEYIETTRQFDKDLRYAVPYMYGTLGLVYDYSQTKAHINSWSALFGDTYAGDNTRSVKDSVRDAYCAACLYNARSSLIGLTGTAQKTAVQAIFEDTSDATIAGAEAALKKVKKGGAVWDVDDIKFDMATGNSKVKVALMWSCDAGYVMNDYEDDDGNNQEGCRDLWYVVPDEGGNVYIDAFVISKYAVNTKAAQMFLQFLCRKDIAVKNSEYAGAISPVAAAYDQLKAYYTQDPDGIFVGTEPGWKEMFIETMFPGEATLNRCGVMKYFFEGNAAVNAMWDRLQ